MQLLSHTLSDNPSLCAEILKAYPDKRIFCLYGDLGAGKTTLIQSFCRSLGVTEAVNSPTFALVNTYQSNHGEVYHFDFYRIKSELEAYDIGYEEYFYSGNYCFVEWGERIAKLLPEEAVHIHIQLQADGSRLLQIS